MSDYPTPDMPPPAENTPPPAPQSPAYDTSASASEVVVVSESRTVQKRSPLHPAGTTLTVLGLIAGLVPVLALVFGSAIKLETLSAVQSAATIGTLLVVASAGLALIATIVNLLRPSSTGKGVSLIVSLVTLVGMAALLFTTVLPRDTNLQNLNNTLAPFGTSIRDNCQTPLNTETAHYNQVAKDSAPITSTDPSQVVAALGGFASSMKTDATMFQTDATNLQGNLTNLQNLKVPESKYQALHDGCIADVQATITVLTGTGITSDETAMFYSAIQTAVTGLPTTTIPAAAKPIILATIKNSLPSTYSFVSLLQTAAAYAGCGGNPLNACTTVQLTWPPKVPTSTQQSLATFIYVIVGAGFTQFVNTAMMKAAAQSDPQLTTEGNQLKDDIKKILRDNLAPINVDVNAIVGS